MKETELQRFICKAVEDKGGLARKLSHRFVVGVPDLLVKLPDYPAGLLEVKQREGWPNADLFTPGDGVTKLQEEFLKNAARAGMPAGVVSFIQIDGRKGLHMCVCPIRMVVQSGGMMLKTEHQFLGTSDQERYVKIEMQLSHFFSFATMKERG